MSSRHLRRLIKRTLNRDRGAENWNRLDIYLDEKLFCKPCEEALQSPDNDERLQDLQAVIAGFSDPVNPNHKEKLLLWVHAFEACDDYDTEVEASLRLARESDLRRNTDSPRPF